MLYLELFWSFVKIGFTSFGGLSMVPLITSEMLSHGWMTLEEVADIVGIAEMTPGPLGLNCATFTGVQAGGLFGALAANLGVLTPTLSLATLAAVFFERFRRTTVMEKILTGVRPAGFGLIVGIMFSLAAANYFPDSGPDWYAMAIGALDAVLLLWRKWSITAVIGLSAGLGMLCYGLLPML